MNVTSFSSSLYKEYLPLTFDLKFIPNVGQEFTLCGVTVSSCAFRTITLKDLKEYEPQMTPKLVLAILAWDGRARKPSLSSFNLLTNLDGGGLLPP